MSVNVLKEGVIQFEPPLPKKMVDVLKKVEMANLVKVVLVNAPAGTSLGTLHFQRTILDCTVSRHVGCVLCGPCFGAGDLDEVKQRWSLYHLLHCTRANNGTKMAFRALSLKGRGIV